MKQCARLFAGLVTFGATAAVVSSLTVAAEPGSAKVQAIRAGSAQFSTDGATWNTLQVGTTLQAGASVKTDAAGVVDLDLGANGPAVRLTPATTLNLTTLSVVQGAGEKIATTELGLPAGKIHAVVRKLSASSKWEVKTPVSTCGVRGTAVTVTSRGNMVVSKGAGYVRYTAPGETTPRNFDVPNGYTFDPSLNNNKGGVVKTLPSVELELEQNASGLVTAIGVTGGAPGWAPSPAWSVPPSKGGNLGQGGQSDPPQNLVPITQPTTPIAPK